MGVDAASATESSQVRIAVGLTGERSMHFATRHAQSESYRADIDGLRALAVLAVIVFHAAPSMMPGGYIGVDIFFVISGFLISGIIFRQCEASRFNWVEFYARRVKRIFPALIVVLTFVLVFGWFEGIPDEFAQLGKHVVAGAAFFSNWAFWLETGYFDGAAELKPLLHLWSLGLEEQFYLAWPVIVPLVFRYKRQWLTQVIVALIVLSFVESLIWVEQDASAAFFLIHTRFWELLCGGLLAAFALRRPDAASPLERRLRYDLLAGAGLLVLSLCTLYLKADLGFPGWWALFPVLSTMAAIHGAERSRWVAWLLSYPLLVGIGIISYPLYLWHLPLITFLKTTDIAEVTRTSKIVVVAMSFFLAWATYRFVERPVRFGNTWGSRRVAAHLILVMALVASGGLWIYAAHGFPHRYPASMQPLLVSGAIPSDQNQNAMEFGTCFLNPQQDREEFSAKGYDPERAASGVEEVLLWGDSHAAHLYPGLAELYRERNVRFVRLGAAGCPPIDRDVRGKPMCQSINEHVRQVVDTRRPQTVILAADWISGNPDDVQTTIRFLRSRSVRRIVLVGPVPQWTKPLYKIVISDALRQKDHIVPLRIAHSLVERVPEVDAHMRVIAAEEGVEYVSVWDALCNEDGCIARIGDGFEGIITLDRSHLTPAGSLYVVKRLFGEPLGYLD